MADEFVVLLRRHVEGLVELTEAQVALLTQHYDLLSRWNRVLNLTAIRTVEDVVIRHYCECLYFASLLPATGRILDLGSGAGFPGVPISVLHPGCSITLLESHKRKAVFLREATRELSNITVLAERAEDVSGDWDLLVARAVSPSEVLHQVPRLSQRVGLLVGGASVTPAPTPSPMNWDAPVRLPWGDDRWAVFGNVPRGT